MTPTEINESCARGLGWVQGLQFWNHKDKIHLLRNVPNYCGDIGAAWEIVEFLRPKKLEFSIEVNGNKFIAQIWDQRGNNPRDHNWIAWDTNADTASMAIALVFLKLNENK